VILAGLAARQPKSDSMLDGLGNGDWQKIKGMNTEREICRDQISKDLLASSSYGLLIDYFRLGM
jgi:hypothetical protein